MTRIYIPSPGPEAWKQFLAEPGKQWKTGYSARTLAQAWEAAEGLPPEITELFVGAAEFQGEKPGLLLAIPEHKVPLPGGQREPSSSNTPTISLQKRRRVRQFYKGSLACRFH